MNQGNFEIRNRAIFNALLCRIIPEDHQYNRKSDTHSYAQSNYVWSLLEKRKSLSRQHLHDFLEDLCRFAQAEFGTTFVRCSNRQKDTVIKNFLALNLTFINHTFRRLVMFSLEAWLHPSPVQQGSENSGWRHMGFQPDMANQA